VSAMPNLRDLSNVACVVGVDESDEMGTLPHKSQLSLHVEAVTNAVKYAFPHNGAGRIDVVFKQRLAGEIVLCVADNGVGLPNNYETGRSKSLGMGLIEGLSRALQARLHIHSCPGTAIEVVFAEAH